MGAGVLKVDIPEEVRAAAGVPEDEFDTFVREALAIELYRRGRVSLGKAAELAGVTRWDIMAIMVKHGAWLNMTTDDIMADVEILAQVRGR
jgi:predicted HTH domain antitoxin